MDTELSRAEIELLLSKAAACQNTTTTGPMEDFIMTAFMLGGITPQNLYFIEKEAISPWLQTDSIGNAINYIISQRWEIWHTDPQNNNNMKRGLLVRLLESIPNEVFIHQFTTEMNLEGYRYGVVVCAEFTRLYETRVIIPDIVWPLLHSEYPHCGINASGNVRLEFIVPVLQLIKQTLEQVNQ